MCSDDEQDAVFAEAVANGYFASEEEARKEQEAEGDNAVPSTEVVVIEVDEENPDPPVNPLDVPDHYDLPMYGSIIACPKCGCERVNSIYHAHGVLSEPCGTRFGWPDIQNLGEHLCRRCTNCQYGWPEAVFSGA